MWHYDLTFKNMKVMELKMLCFSLQCTLAVLQTWASWTQPRIPSEQKTDKIFQITKFKMFYGAGITKHLNELIVTEALASALVTDRELLSYLVKAQPVRPDLPAELVSSLKAKISSDFYHLIKLSILWLPTNPI